jgi:hypothetical protein
MRRFCCFAPSALAQGIPITEVSRWPRTQEHQGHRRRRRSGALRGQQAQRGRLPAATVARRLRDEGRTLDAPLRPATEVARRAGHGAAVLLKIYAHCIDGRADAANKPTVTQSSRYQVSAGSAAGA